MRSTHILGAALAMTLAPIAFLSNVVRITERPDDGPGLRSGVHRTASWKRRKPSRMGWGTVTYFKPNGERECARRRRQIAAGILRRENGLRI